MAAAVVARAETAPRPQQLVVREVQAKRRRLLESASLMRVVVVEVAVKAATAAADLRLPAVQEELVAAEPAGVLADRSQRQELQVRRIPVAVVALVDIATHRYGPPPVALAAQALSLSVGRRTSLVSRRVWLPRRVTHKYHSHGRHLQAAVPPASPTMSLSISRVAARGRRFLTALRHQPRQR